MPASTYLANALLAHSVGAAAYTMPTTIYVGLSSTTPNADGTNITEPVGGAYARVAVDGTFWPAPSNGSVTNGTIVNFPTASGTWLDGAALRSFVICDALTGGNLLCFGALLTSYAVGDRDNLGFTSTLTITLS